MERNVNSSDSRGMLSTYGRTPSRGRAGWSVSARRLHLQVEPAVALLVAPVGVQPPEEAVLLAGVSACSAAVPGASISAIRVLREML